MLFGLTFTAIQTYVQGKKDDRAMDEAIKNPNRRDSAGELDDLFRGMPKRD